MASAVEDSARWYATGAHVGQKRKYTGEPYINHPRAVADLVRVGPHTEYMLAAAWLHDVLEDTSITAAQMAPLFHPKILELVQELTDDIPREAGNRAHRKYLYNLKLAIASPEAKTIKLADITDNCSNIVERDPEFAKVYLDEKVAQLAVLGEGDPALLTLAYNTVRFSKALLDDTEEQPMH